MSTPFNAGAIALAIAVSAAAGYGLGTRAWPERGPEIDLLIDFVAASERGIS